MHLVYIDESKTVNRLFVYSAVMIHETRWHKTLAFIKDYRRKLRQVDGIYIAKELHASPFCAGKGNIGDRVISKTRRCEIFKETLHFITTIERFHVFNAANVNEQYAFERLINRINRTMEAKKSFAHLIFDAGNEVEITKRIRRMGVHNPIPSAYGAWDDGKPTANITINRIIEDAAFKDSASSYFIQLADFVAYALMRREVPLPSKNAYGLDKAFDLVAPACFKGANRNDPYGIIR